MAKKKIKIKQTLKDSVFCNLFAEPENQYKLYKVLHPEDSEVSVSDFKTVTINNVITNQQYNDLGFTVRNRLVVLVEAQSTWSVNIILRVIMYYAQTLYEYIIDTGKDIYNRKKVDVPKPEFYVVYTGAEKKNVKDVYSAAEEYFGGDNGFLDVRVRVIAADEDSRDIVQQYITFTRILNEQIKVYGRTVKAVRETIRICKHRDILRKYLSGREKEVIDMMTALYDQEEVTKAFARAYGNEKKEEGREEGREEGIKEGMAKGKKKQARKTAAKLAKMGMAPEQIAAAVGFSTKKVEKWLDIKAT